MATIIESTAAKPAAVEPGLAAISQALGQHYAATFDKHGATAKGVDWGPAADVTLRYEKMLDVLEPGIAAQRTVSLLDVGCGYGGLLEHAQGRGIALDYTGIDMAENMIAHARASFPPAAFHAGDVLALAGSRQFDYVVCNGILTQKLLTSIMAMNVYAQRLMRKMFDLCQRGVAFNIMSNQVNFMAENLYYRSPVEVLSFALSELTRKVRIDHAYRLYEYTVYLYRDEP